jgi:hypothetical protein
MNEIAVQMLSRGLGAWHMGEKLTEAKIESAVRAGTGGKSQRIVWASDPVGLGLRIREEGSVTWIYHYRPAGGAAKPLKLGAYPALTLRAATAAAKAKAGEIALGRDPAAERRLERTRERRITSRALDEFELTIRRRRLVNAPTIMSTLRRGLASLATREIDALERADFVERIDALEAAGKPGAATDLRKHARSLLEWCVSKGLVRHNVLAGLRKAARQRRRADRRRAQGPGVFRSRDRSRMGVGGLAGAFWRPLEARAAYRHAQVRTRRIAVAGHSRRQDRHRSAWDQDRSSARSSCDCRDARRVDRAGARHERPRVSFAPSKA